MLLSVGWCSLFLSTAFATLHPSITPLPTLSPQSLPQRHSRLDLYRRQDTQDVSTRTITPSATVTEVSAVATSETTRTASHIPIATTPVPLAATMGLIMPNPWQKVYTGVNYTFGFVDAVPRPAPLIGGWLRHVQPLLIFPNYAVDIFPSSGQDDPSQEGAVPPGSDGLCGATAEDFSISYPFVFEKPGYYMFVINQTWLQPTVDPTERTCKGPILSQRSFFAWQVLSVAPAPTITPGPADPTAAYTVFAAVSTDTPSSLPQDLSPASSGQKLAVGFGVTGAVIALACIGGIVWWVRKKHKMEAETLAFSRLSETDKAAFLAENPNHFLNPNRPSARYRETSQPPGPPGSAAYAQWYWDQMRNRQQSSWRWGSRYPQSSRPTKWQSQGWYHRPQQMGMSQPYVDQMRQPVPTQPVFPVPVNGVQQVYPVYQPQQVYNVH